MKNVFAVAVAALAGSAIAAPSGELEARQSSASDSCAGKKAVFIFARGSTEPGNMVSQGHVLKLSFHGLTSSSRVCFLDPPCAAA